MRAEIAEQPAVLDGIVANHGAIAEAGARIAAHKPRFVLLAARGSSDHAALYAKYLIETLVQLPVGLVSPSTTTIYGARPDLTDVVLITASQSGGSPDLLEVTETAKAAGALTVAVTNTPDSTLHETAELAVDMGAGTERAVAATKSYTATLLALYLLIDAWRGGRAEHAREIGSLATGALQVPVAEAADRYRFADRLIACGRGYSLASAHEAGLKLAETAYLATRSYSGADLLHGPVAAVDRQTPVLAITSAGKGGAAMGPVLDTVRAAGADLLTVGSAENANLRTPECAEELAPVLEIIPVQQIALELALARGGDPDNPRGLHKVTETR
ncbi:SIS domain-containing protein [Sciscionella marina]|uniref:SIS domain-containing protein n=1 Tax=Sciscionella marina TaxID=508770 RepID=UPI0003609698|nr:SIS domain-containing protein [Sciscionella marina]